MDPLDQPQERRKTIWQKVASAAPFIYWFAIFHEFNNSL